VSGTIKKHSAFDSSRLGQLDFDYSSIWLRVCGKYFRAQVTEKALKILARKRETCQIMQLSL
jgi:hypothetical protein